MPNARRRIARAMLGANHKMWLNVIFASGIAIWSIAVSTVTEPWLWFVLAMILFTTQDVRKEHRRYLRRLIPGCSREASEDTLRRVLDDLS